MSKLEELASIIADLRLQLGRANGSIVSEAEDKEVLGDDEQMDRAIANHSRINNFIMPSMYMCLIDTNIELISLNIERNQHLLSIANNTGMLADATRLKDVRTVMLSAVAMLDDCGNRPSPGEAHQLAMDLKRIVSLIAQ